MRRGMLHLGLALAVLVLAACAPNTAAYANATAPATASAPTVALTAQPTSPSPTASPSASPAAVTALTPAAETTYTDPTIGYAFDYPSGWHIQATPGWLVVVTSFDPATSPGQGGIPQNQTKVDLAPAKPAENLALDEMIAQVRAGEAKVLREERWELTGGMPAVRMQVTSEAAGEMAVLLTVIDGHSLRLTGYGDLIPFDAIARSLRRSDRR